MLENKVFSLQAKLDLKMGLSLATVDSHILIYFIFSFAVVHKCYTTYIQCLMFDMEKNIYGPVTNLVSIELFVIKIQFYDSTISIMLKL